MRGMKLATIATTIALAACGSSKNWSEQPLQPTTCERNGVAVSVSLPKDLEAWGDPCQWKKDLSSDSYLQVRITVRDRASLEDALDMTAKQYTVVRKDKTADGSFVLAKHVDEARILEVETWNAGTKLACEAHGANLSNPDATLRWLATICDSVKRAK
jgi:hypothetical protein